MGNNEGPTKTDLLRALKQYETSESAHLRELREKQNLARIAVDKFLKGNREYQKLERASSVADEKHFRVLIEERDRINYVRAQVFTKGPTPEVTKMVQDLGKAMHAK